MHAVAAGEGKRERDAFISPSHHKTLFIPLFFLSPSCPLADNPTDTEVLRHWIYHIESTMQYADEHSEFLGGERQKAKKGEEGSTRRFFTNPTTRLPPFLSLPHSPWLQSRRHF